MAHKINLLKGFANGRWVGSKLVRTGGNGKKPGPGVVFAAGKAGCSRILRARVAIFK